MSDCPPGRVIRAGRHPLPECFPCRATGASRDAPRQAHSAPRRFDGSPHVPRVPRVTPFTLFPCVPCPGSGPRRFRAQRSRRQQLHWRRRPRPRSAPLPTRLFAPYCGCGSDRRLLSSCMSTATLASAWACWRPWCAQKSSSPELASSTRTYAWAPQRSQTSSAVSGLVGASAPVNVAFPRVVPPASASVWLRFSVPTAQHNTYPGVSVPHSEWCTPQAKPPTDGAWPQLPPFTTRCLRPTGTRGQYR